MARIIPSLASADPLALGQQIRQAGAGHLHLDVEDGNFVPNITFGLKTICAVAQSTRARLDGHLMVTNPADYVAPLAAAGLWALCAHIEAVPYPLELLGKLRGAGLKAGLALNFKTPAEALAPFASALDYVLVMTAEPDNQGQAFSPPMLDKLRAVRGLLPPGVSVWADGGIGEDQLAQVVAAGTDTVILGRAIWGGGDPQKAGERLSTLANGHWR